MSIPKIMIAGTHSGVGKTLISLAVMAGFKKDGRRVGAYKVGPDYIDPGYHQWVTGRPSHNLDEWMMGRDAVRWLFAKTSHDCDIAVIEGVMGLFDGASSTEDAGSSAGIAKLLNIPVVLVVDASRMARSVAAIIKGFQTLDRDLHIGGVILNRVSSTHHLEILTEAVGVYNKIPVLGALLNDQQLSVPQRHLGLKTISENPEFQKVIERLGEFKNIKLDKIYDIARSYSDEEPGDVAQVDLGQKVDKKVRIAYALDRAFQFYYRANLDFLESCGAELVPFSPLEDAKLPDNIGGLYLGGGFPEIYAEMIEYNHTMRQALKHAIEDGLPTYAECGGLIYLAESVTTLDGKKYQMAGVVPGEIEMTGKLVHFGYCENELLSDCFLGGKGEVFRGHEFHYSRWKSEGVDPAHRVEKKRRNDIRNEGYVRNNLLASYVHCHFLSYPKRALTLVEQARNWLASKKETVSIK